MSLSFRSVFPVIAVSSLLLFISSSDIYGRDGHVPGIQAFRQACDSVENYMSKRCWCQYPLYIKTAYITNKGRKNAGLEITACRDMAYFPFRDGDIEHIYEIFRKMMPEKYAQYRNRFTIKANNHRLQAYSPAFFSKKGADYYVSEHRTAAATGKKGSLITELNTPCTFNSGLSGRHIALWQSHGYYFNQTNNRWEWQRGRIFGTSEDLYTQSYVIPYLVPMLENAGATVLLPRERDINGSEIIVDNDNPSSGYSENGKWSAAPKKGFSYPESSLGVRENPFKNGTARQIHDSSKNRYARWQPEITEDGEYSVYVSYQSLPASSENARYTVYYDGGSRSFKVNQKLGGGTWIHLGRFPFRKGRLDNQYVVLECQGNDPNSVITADAVKFGGGQGNVSRGGIGNPSGISGKPRYMEGARYWLQWAGFNDSIYSPAQFRNDYKDDVKCRALWVNSLIYNYNIPIDLSFAFHTDAGLRKNDSIVGTLAIHTWKYDGTIKYKNGERRFLARDFADIVQSQVVNDIRSLYDSTWTRRGLWDRSYAECSSEQVPSMILELLSHQNFNDMRYGLDPVFRFSVSRAVYKGITRFLSWLNNTECVIQPLPVRHFNVKIQNVSGRNYAVLSWKENIDLLEPTAVPDKFIVYRRTDSGGFDNGTAVSSNSVRFEIEKGHLYSFKVCAANEGGISFPSETLCAAVAPDNSGKYALVVNNFTRISGPASFMTSDSLQAGFRYSEDAGVPYLYDIAYCGDQYEYRTDAEWESNDNPGFGASRDNYERTFMAGNTFDNVALHSSALLKAGYGIVSSSRESLMSGEITANDYPLLDLVCGKQKSTKDAVGRDYSIFPDAICEVLSKYASGGRSLIVSGAYLASDCIASASDAGLSFLNSVLKIIPAVGKPSNEGMIAAVNGKKYSYFTEPNPERYHIEKPDGIAPAGSNAKSVLSFTSGKASAGVVFKSKDYKSAAITIPIEALRTEAEMDGMIEYLTEALR